jgi:hypothetical protein
MLPVLKSFDVIGLKLTVMLYSYFYFLNSEVYDVDDVVEWNDF